ncbi:MAG: HU family DNA-binding protein [Anaerolineales bacterium]|nr:HU family DNA-binding protein [Anaerolineales bacterium]
MSDRTEKDELVERISRRTGNSAATVEKIVDATLEEIYAALKHRVCVLLKNFGTFYIRPERESWVFKFNFNPSQRLRKLFGWSSTYKGRL